MDRRSRIASFGFAALFAIGAIVQWNDPDPLAWMLGYGVAAALSVAAGLGRRLFWPNVLVTLIFGLWFATLASALVGAPAEAFTTFEMRATAHEEPREAGGLALLTVWSAVLAWRARPETAGRPSS